jgi:hypothetical protein
MRRFAIRAVGSLLFFLAVALSLSGVRVVRAEIPAAAADAPMCREPGPPASLEVQRMRAVLAARARAEAEANADFVPLPTTGYGYRGTNPVDLAPVERELRTPR